MWNDQQAPPQVQANSNYVRVKAKVPCSSDILKYICQYRMPQIKAIQKKLRVYDAVIYTDVVNGIEVIARREGIDEAKQLINELIDRVVCDHFEIVQPGITTFCAKGKMNSLVRMVENEEKCFVRVQKETIQPSSQPSGSSTDGSAGDASGPAGTAGPASPVGSSVRMSLDSSEVFVSPQGHKISWKIGDITTEQAHTLVSPQGVCSKAVFSAAGPNISKIYQAPQAGEITLTPGYLLPCSHVIHTCCCMWGGGNGEATLRSIVQKCLVKVSKLGGSSIAFPAIGTGKLGFPPHEASRIMLDEAVTFCQNNPHSSVKDIRFVLFHGSQAVIDAFKQEGNALQTKNRKTVEVIQGDLTQESTDAIVNIIGTDMNINGAGQLGKAVSQASGFQVEDECQKLGPQPAGCAVMTSGGNLAVPNIIHMVVGSMNKQHLQLCLEESLKFADLNGLKTISLPAVGTGAGGLSEMDSAQATFQALRKVFKTCINVREVRIVLFQATLVAAFQIEHKLYMQEQENQQAVSSPAPVKTEEPPRKKPRMTQDGVTGGVTSGVTGTVTGGVTTGVTGSVTGGVTDSKNKHKVKIYITGASKASVKRATDTLKRGIAEAFTTQKIEQQSIGQLTKNQISGLKKCAKGCDVKLVLEVSQSVNRILVHGEHSSVAEMVGKIWSVLNERADTNQANKQTSIPTTSLPTNWVPMPLDKDGNDVTVHAVELKPLSREYQDVAAKFQQTAGSVAIVSIQRIQNPHLYQTYQLRKEKMERDNGGNSERQLFHGTSPDSVTKISTGGFNRSFAGHNGAAFGKGVYFARDASYSLGYAARSGASVGNRCMFLSRVLVGQYCNGYQGMAEPPPKDLNRPEILFDSMVDDIANPTIFVVFRDDRCYPEYLIKF